MRSASLPLAIAGILLIGCAAEYTIDERMQGTSIAFLLTGRDTLEIFNGSPGCETSAKPPEQYNPFHPAAQPLPLVPGQEFMVTFGTDKVMQSRNGVNVHTCSPTVAFIPEKGQHYRASLVYSPTSCMALVTSIVTVGNRQVVRPEPTLRAIIHTATDPRTILLQPGEARAAKGPARGFSARSTSCPAAL